MGEARYIRFPFKFMWKKFLLERGLSESTLDSAKISYIFPWIRIPYLNEKYEVVKGRWFAQTSNKSKMPKYIWLRGKPQFPYNWYPDQWEIFLYICEGELDTLLLLQDLPNQANVVGLPLGALTFKNEWAEVIRKTSIKIFTLLDNDKAGQNGAQRIANLLLREVYQVIWPNSIRGYDVTDFARGNTTNLLERLSKLNYQLIKPIRSDLIVRRYRKREIIDNENDLEELKKIPLEVVIGNFGIKLIKTSDGFKVHCPFHEDRMPSLFINVEKNLFYCFSCGAGGSVLDFIMKIKNNIRFEAAANYLRDNYANTKSSN